MATLPRVNLLPPGHADTLKVEPAKDGPVTVATLAGVTVTVEAGGAGVTVTVETVAGDKVTVRSTADDTHRDA
jgi:hypothetical protein